MKKITFIAHGSSKPEALNFLKNLVSQIDNSGNVNLAFFEFGQPDIPTAIQDHIAHGATSVHAIPLFIVPGKHITQDIPPIIEKIKSENANINIVLEPQMGSRPEFKELLIRLINQ